MSPSFKCPLSGIAHLLGMESERTAKAKIAAIAATQKASTITGAFRPEHLLTLIIGMSRAELLEMPPSPQVVRSVRSALYEAVERLVRL